MTKFFNIFKENLFLAHFCLIFQFSGQKKFFLENPALSRTTSRGFLAPCQNLEKTNDTIVRKRLDRRKDRQTLLHRNLPANAGRPLRVDKI